MDGASASVAGQQLAMKRWGSTKPVRLAHELAERAHELPAGERVALRNALAMVDINGKEQR